jgi:hypothetical protein
LVSIYRLKLAVVEVVVEIYQLKTVFRLFVVKAIFLVSEVVVAATAAVVAV